MIPSYLFTVCFITLLKNVCVEYITHMTGAKGTSCRLNFPFRIYGKKV